MRYADIRPPTHTTFEDLCKGIVEEYILNKRKSLERMEGLIKNLSRFFLGKLAHEITTALCRKYQKKRMDEGMSNGTINRELSALRRAFTLAYRETPPLVSQVPYIPTLKENNVRTGFFEYEEFLAHQEHLPKYAQIWCALAFHSGMRAGEVSSLQWTQMNLDLGFAWLKPIDTKTSQPRLFYFTEELLETLIEWRAHTKAKYPFCPWVCHRNGRQLKTCRYSFKKASAKIGMPGMIPNDFRRSAVRDYDRAGTPRSVAKQISGHKTDSVYNRYNIVSEKDLQHAAYLKQQYHKKSA